MIEIKIIEINRKKSFIKRMGPSICGLMIVVLATILDFLDILSDNAIIILGVLGLFWIIYSIYVIFIFKAYDVIGNVSFFKDTISLLDTQIRIVEIESLNIIYADVFGQATGGIYIKQGDKNEIKLLLKNGKVFNYRFFLESNFELNYIMKIYKLYKKTGVPITLKHKSKSEWNYR